MKSYLALTWKELKTAKNYSDFNPDCSYHVNDHNNRCWSVHWNFAVYENRAGCEPKRKPLCNISSTQQGTSTETP